LQKRERAEQPRLVNSHSAEGDGDSSGFENDHDLSKVDVVDSIHSSEGDDCSPCLESCSENMGNGMLSCEGEVNQALEPFTASESVFSFGPEAIGALSRQLLENSSNGAEDINVVFDHIQ